MKLRCVFLSLSFTLLTQVNLVSSTDVFANNSLAIENITSILQTRLLLNSTDEETTDDLYSNNTDVPEEDYVDFSLLHPDKAQDLYRIAKTKNSMAEIVLNKTIDRQGRQSDRNREEESYFYNPFFINKSMDLMTQSVYTTRARLLKTKPLRKKLSYKIEYNAALMYGSLMQLRLKMDNLYATMTKLIPRDTKFIWYLVLYERCLSFSVDISQMVKELFHMETGGSGEALEHLPHHQPDASQPPIG